MTGDELVRECNKLLESDLTPWQEQVVKWIYAEKVDHD
jgi:hypothetical protein